MRIYANMIPKYESATWEVRRLCLALFVAMSVGCSGGKLDRNAAAAKISERMASLGTVHNLDIGRIGTNCGYDPQIQGERDPDHDIGTVVASKVGYVTVVPDGQGYWKVSLTGKGQSASPRTYPGGHIVRNGCDYTIMAFPVGKPVFVAVTGIIPDSANTSIAEYDWKWTLTDLGRELREGGSIYSQLSANDRDLLQTLFYQYDPVLHLPVPADLESKVDHGRALFMKYDDGWRLKVP